MIFFCNKALLIGIYNSALLRAEKHFPLSRVLPFYLLPVGLFYFQKCLRIAKTVHFYKLFKLSFRWFELI